MMTLKFLSIFLCLIATALLGFWYLVPKLLEQPSYKVIRKEGNIEIRRYDSMLLQSVAVSGEQYEALRQGFRPLVNYIGAKQRDGDKISMTVPVMQSIGNSDKDWVVSFSMPSKYKKSNLPDPKNDKVYTEKIHPTNAAVIRFSSTTNEDFLQKKTEELLNWLKRTKYEIQSKPKYLFYNDPSTPGFLRRNEVLILINHRSDS